MKLRRVKERGFALIVAVFLLVVLAGLGVAIANLSAMQHPGSAMDVQGVRAYQAARAGIEWGLHKSLIGNSPACPAGPTSFAMPRGTATLADFTVTVTCTTTTNGDTSPSVVVMQLTSVACNQPTGSDCPNSGGSADYVQRVVQATFQASSSAPVIYLRELH